MEMEVEMEMEIPANWGSNTRGLYEFRDRATKGVTNVISKWKTISREKAISPHVTFVLAVGERYGEISHRDSKVLQRLCGSGGNVRQSHSVFHCNLQFWPYLVSLPRYSEILVENRDFLINFYRATRMHCADYAVARCLSVRLSLCLSDTRRYSVETA